MNNLLKRFKNIQLCILVLCLSMLSFFTAVHAQQDSQFAQYMYNTISVNPAYAGSRGSLNILGAYRNQWVGMDGAPKTLNFSVHSPIGLQGVGLGLGFTSDEIGPSSESIITADFSYALYLEETLKLSFGLKGGLSIWDLDPNKLNIYDPNDYSLRQENYKSPIIGLGLYLYTEKWYMGVSSPNILKTDYQDDVQVSTATEKTHVYFIGGYVFTLNPYLKLKPAVLAKGVIGAPLALDVSANALLHDKVTFGLAYRLDAAISALAGFQISDQLMIGYAYDYDTSGIRNYNDGSHEIFLRFELGTRLRAKVNPRFF
ncbi:type IX secretion system membrane protein PorP/SprF [Mariniflexile ostreae]|uniref:Type IX secretion system membrane protein PorP/SprF n=1 Tax=Mariniflexile ostreae TaxID=1520892 RepID=A0ABV5FBG8_9FLAO